MPTDVKICTDNPHRAQFHTWLTTGIPDGQPKLLLSFLPYEDFPLLNFAMATASASPVPSEAAPPLKSALQAHVFYPRLQFSLASFDCPSYMHYSLRTNLNAAEVPWNSIMACGVMFRLQDALCAAQSMCLSPTACSSSPAP